MKTDGKFVLDDNLDPVPETDLLAWGRWMQNHSDKRAVGRDIVGDSTVSTVFAGIDMSFEQNGAPWLYETMVFGGDNDGWGVRYSSRKEAEEGHERAVELLKANIPLE